MPRIWLPSILLLVILAACNSSSGKTYPDFPVLWSYQSLLSTDVPALVGDHLIGKILDVSRTKVGSQQAFDLETRTPAWEYKDRFLGYHATFVNKTLLLGTTNGIYFINSQGVKLKFVPYPDQVASALLPGLRFQTYDNRLFVPTDDAVLVYSLDQLLGPDTSVQPLWKVGFKNTDIANNLDSFAIDAKTGIVFVAGNASSRPPEEYRVVLQAYTQEGQKLWETDLINVKEMPLPRANLDAENGKVAIILSAQAQLMAYDTQGKLLWKNPFFVCPGGATSLYSYVYVKDGMVIPIPLGDHCLSAWDLNTGKNKWIFEDKNYSYTFDNLPVALNGIVYAANTYLWAIDQETGKVLGRSQELSRAQGPTGTVIHDAKRNQLLIWADQLWAFKPLR